ncbi:MAG: hypothetical protein ACE5R6_10580 [Candidatus Heimdallarchaeota archaeon]
MPLLKAYRFIFESLDEVFKARIEKVNTAMVSGIVGLLFVVQMSVRKKLPPVGA